MANITDSLKRLVAKRPGNKVYRYLFIAGAVVIVLAGYYAFTLLIDPTVLPQQAVHLLQDAAILQAGQQVLVFSPHPDDETIGVGGYIAEAVQQGANVTIVLVTNGNRHRNEAVRYAEFKKATSILGVREGNLVFMGLPDFGLSKINESTLSQLLKQQTDNFSPDIIIYPDQHDFHPDHAAIGRAMTKIIAGYGNAAAYSYLVHYEFYYPHPRRLAPSLYLLPPSRLVRFGNGWQKVMLPQSIEDLKEEAIYSYKSQLGDPLLKDLLLSSIRQNELLLPQ